MTVIAEQHFQASKCRVQEGQVNEFIGPIQCQPNAGHTHEHTERIWKHPWVLVSILQTLQSATGS